ncbi:arylacetamide deacetylase-like [Mytilus californianus]|uniref:arylacetamide deacetylase-like n=1 Tax=Mytilus californianus TaxID=6549 RepID=UPI002246B511|nr:arylacetamide deacetylase-like [Mytilus californianus]
MPSWLTCTVIIVCIAYYLYIPLPENAAEPWKQRFTYSTFKIINDVARIAGIFGFSKINVTRSGLGFYPLVDWLISKPINDIKIVDNVFDGVKVRLYYPTTSEEKMIPAVVYFHGGGWVFLDADKYDNVMKRLSSTTDFVIIFVEYRKAPEHIFPAAFDDCVKATLYLLQKGKDHGVDTKRIGLAGDSAGGNLAMAVSLKIGEQQLKLPPLRFQVLIYPTLQALDLTLSSFQEFDVHERQECTLVTKGLMIFWLNMYAFGHLNYTASFVNNSHVTSASKKMYRKLVDPKLLPEKYQTVPNDDVESSIPNVQEVEKILLNPYYAPLMMTDKQLKTLPKTLIMTCDLDGLRDEGYILAARMRNIGHDVKHENYKGMDHGFIWFSYYEAFKEGNTNLSLYVKNNM